MLDKIIRNREGWGGVIVNDVEELLKHLEGKDYKEWEEGYFARRSLLMLEAKYARLNCGGFHSEQ